MREKEKFHRPICRLSFDSIVDELEHEFRCSKALRLRQAMQEKEEKEKEEKDAD